MSIQAGWARANDVNLLAANIQEPMLGYTGSGIYSPKSRFIRSFMGNTSRMIIEELPVARDDLITSKVDQVGNLDIKEADLIIKIGFYYYLH